MGASGLLVLLCAAKTTTVEPSEPAHPPVHVVTSGSIPFPAAEFEKALLARLPPGVPAGTLSLTMRSDGLVELSWQSMRRAVDVSNESGSAAARIVALLAADLFMPLSPPPLPPPAPEPSPFRQSATFLVGGYEVSSGGGESFLLHGVTMSAGRDGRLLRLRASAGWMTSATQNLLTMTAWPLRIGAGVGTSYASFVASFVMIPYELQGIVDVARMDAGAGADVEGRFAIAVGFSLYALAGGDLFLSQRQRVVAGDVTLYRSPLLALRFGLGLAWEIPR